MPRLFVALPVPDEIADALSALQSGVPDARWVPAENLHITLCFAGEVQGGTMRDFEEELADIAGPPFPVAIAGVDQFSNGKQPRALVALVERSERLDWLQQKVTTVARNFGIEVDRRKYRPHVTLARFPRGRRDRPPHRAVHGEPRHVPSGAVGGRALHALFEPHRTKGPIYAPVKRSIG